MIEDATKPKPPPIFTPEEFKLKDGKFTADDIPRLIATLDYVSQQLFYEKRSKDTFLHLICGIIYSRTPPLQPPAMKVPKKSMMNVPRDFQIKINDTPDALILSVDQNAAQPPRILVPGL